MVGRVADRARSDTPGRTLVDQSPVPGHRPRSQSATGPVWNRFWSSCSVTVAAHFEGTTPSWRPFPMTRSDSSESCSCLVSPPWLHAVAFRSAGCTVLWCGEHGAWGVAVGLWVFAPLATLNERIHPLAVGGARRRARGAASRLDAGEVVLVDRRLACQRRLGGTSAVIPLDWSHAGRRWLNQQPDFWDLRPLPWRARAWELAWPGLRGLSRARLSPVLCLWWPEG